MAYAFTQKTIQGTSISSSLYVRNLTNKKKSKNYSRQQRFTKTKQSIQQNDKTIGWRPGNWKKQKGMHWNNIAVGKWWRLLVYVPKEDGENCIDIIYKICELTSTNKKK